MKLCRRGGARDKGLSSDALFKGRDHRAYRSPLCGGVA